jgi:excisionase family DNA binding protein
MKGKTVKNRDLDDALMTPSEVAAIFQVDAKTIARWAETGKLESIRTLGGHRRYPSSGVLALKRGSIPAQHAGDDR